MELQLSGRMGLLESFQKLATKDFPENVCGQEKAHAPRAHPVRMKAIGTARSRDAVNVRMVLQLLIPGMQNAEETDFGAEVSGICSDFNQRLGAGTK